jgi:hypothetical protein
MHRKKLNNLHTSAFFIVALFESKMEKIMSDQRTRAVLGPFVLIRKQK